MGFGPEYNNRSSFGESLDRCNKPDPQDECEHKMKFDHSAHYGQWDMYKCEKCGHEEMFTGKHILP